MKNLILPLRFAIPIVIFLLMLGASFFEFRHTVSFFLSNSEHEAMEHAKEEGSLISKVFENLVKADEEANVKETIDLLTNDPYLKFAFVIDENNRTLYSTRADEARASLAPFAEIDGIVSNARKNRVVWQEISKDRKSLFSAFPIEFREKDETAPAKSGILFLEHEMESENKLGLNLALANFYQFITVLGIVCLLLWAFFEWFFMGRIRKLVYANKLLAEGDYRAKANLSGNDELAYLGASFDAMAEMIKKNSLELEQREEQIRLLLDSTGEAVYGIDMEGRCTFINEIFKKMLGFRDFKDVKGMKIHSLIRHSDKDGKPYQEEDCPILNALKEKKGVHIHDGFIWRSDGTSFPAELWSHPIKHKGETLGAVVTFIDISERKRDELIRQHLSQTEKLSAIGTFVSGVAHELNNPLTAVLGYSDELLKMEGVIDEQRKFLEIISSQARRAADIVKSLLEYSHKETDGKTLASINSVLEASLSFQEYRFRSDNITIERKFGKKLPLVEVDINQLQQVFINIFLNAHQAMLDSTPNGILTVSTSLDCEGKVLVSIENNGPKIPEHLLSKIFDPFFTTKKVGAGTGLGLYISFGILSEHGGLLSVRNLEPTGVCFEITLPPAQTKGKTQKPKKADENETKVPPGTRILLIEEEQDISNLLASSLIRNGIFTMTSSSRKEAMKLLKETEFDVIVASTIILKGGEESLDKWLAEHKPEALSRLVLSSGYMNPEIEEFCTRNDSVFVAKPYHLEEILTAINLILKKRN